MSDFRGRIIDGVASLLQKVGVDDTPLSDVDDGRLQAELEARVDSRNKRGKKQPGDNPLAKMAGGSDAAAKQRRAAADRREKTIHGEREKKRAADKKAQDEAFRRMREQAEREARSGYRPPSGSSSSSSSRSSGRRRSGFGGLGKNDDVAKAYKTLDLPYGSDMSKVKTQFRKLMRKYHPDLHNQTPQKQKAATELTTKVTQAYNTLRDHLDGK